MNQTIDPKKQLQKFIESRDLKQTGLFDDVPDNPYFTVDTRYIRPSYVAP
tara:strand:- start:7069 stop:7218 length:150 start_codon:yes stop_codon:yes gene_type:complete